jgi:2-dehydropantoate 2-reductase
LFADQLAEGLAAIRAEGISRSRRRRSGRWMPPLLRLPDPIFERLLGRTMKIDPEARSSMWEICNSGRRTEIDYLQGVITAIAERRGLQAPLSRRIVELIRRAEREAKGSPGLTPQQIRAAN